MGIEENDSWWTLPHTPAPALKGPASPCSPRESHLEDVFNRLEWLEVGWGRPSESCFKLVPTPHSHCPATTSMLRVRVSSLVCANLNTNTRSLLTRKQGGNTLAVTCWVARMMLTTPSRTPHVQVSPCCEDLLQDVGPPGLCLPLAHHVVQHQQHMGVGVLGRGQSAVGRQDASLPVPGRVT